MSKFHVTIYHAKETKIENSGSSFWVEGDAYIQVLSGRFVRVEFVSDLCVYCLPDGIEELPKTCVKRSIAIISEDYAAIDIPEWNSVKEWSTFIDCGWQQVITEDRFLWQQVITEERKFWLFEVFSEMFCETTAKIILAQMDMQTCPKGAQIYNSYDPKEVHDKMKRISRLEDVKPRSKINNNRSFTIKCVIP